MPFLSTSSQVGIWRAQALGWVGGFNQPCQGHFAYRQGADLLCPTRPRLYPSVGVPPTQGHL
eukprot:15264526-Alexandrium_andersonii.AAC.1